MAYKRRCLPLMASQGLPALRRGMAGYVSRQDVVILASSWRKCSVTIQAFRLTIFCARSSQVPLPKRSMPRHSYVSRDVKAVLPPQAEYARRDTYLRTDT